MEAREHFFITDYRNEDEKSNLIPLNPLLNDVGESSHRFHQAAQITLSK